MFKASILTCVMSISAVEVAVEVAGVGLTTTVVVATAEVQLAIVTVTLYSPAEVKGTFVMLGFCDVLTYPAGPDHDQVATPIEVVEAVRFKVFPLQTGPLFVTVGVKGGFGSTRVCAVVGADGQPELETTYMLVYEPAVSAGIVTDPAPFAVRLMDC